MTIAVYTRHLDSATRQHIDSFMEQLQSCGIVIDEIGDCLAEKHYDFLLSFGGDGTLLNSVHLIGNRNIPVLGINYGHLGFLTSAAHHDLETVIDDLLESRYTVEPRTLLHIDTMSGKKGCSSFALNEATLHRLDDGTLLHTNLYVDNDFVGTYVGDGLIVATPTGSTAYSLSCGGPILTPDSGCFVITPIGAHNLTLRPIIVPDSAELRLVTRHTPEDFSLSMDSRRQHLPTGTEVYLRREQFNIQLVRLHHQTFFTAIHQKLSWGTGGI